MKKSILLTIILLCAVICIAPACKKKTEDPISQLPAATQTGANTFGCLVNGQAYIPHVNAFGSAPYQCNYIYLNGGYYFTLSATEQQTDVSGLEIIIGTVNLPIAQGQTIKLENYNESGKAFGQYAVVGNSIHSYYTTTVTGGQLSITNFNQTNKTVSGTFFFDTVDSSGGIIHVTDGRFDMTYTI